MYVLYADESGSVKNPKEEYFVLAGVAVPESSIRWLSSQVEKIACEFSPSAPQTVELHACDIFSARDGVWKQLQDKSLRIGLIKRVLRVLDQAQPGIVTFASAICKPAFPGEDIMRKAYEDLTSRFDRFLDRQSSRGQEARGLIVFDKTSYEQTLQDLAAGFRRDGNRWGSQLRHICEVPLFVASSASRNVQLADHIAYAVFRYYNAADGTYFKCIEGRFDTDPETHVIHGLAHLGTTRPLCMCPACLTRRFDPARNGPCQ